MTAPLISHFRIMEKLGEGGMGEVYLAEDTRLRRKVALKRLSEAMTQSPDSHQRLLREARMAASLNHPNIAAIYDIFESEKQTHIVMEYVQGESLAQRIKRGPVPVDETLKIGMQICEALAEAHAHEVIHRDLKPANILVTAGTKVKVLDFGLAKRHAPATSKSGSEGSVEETALTTPGVIVGTPAYMAPEQVLGRTADARTDIYGLGVVLYEMLTGIKPFQASTAMGLGMAILTEHPRAVHEVNREVPIGLSEAISRAMAADPQERFQTAAELNAALSRFCGAGELPTAEEIVAIRQVPGRRSLLAKLSWRWGWALIAVLLMAAAVIMTRWSLWPWQSRRVGITPLQIVAVLPFLNLSGDPANEALCSSIAYVLNSNLAAVNGLVMVPYASALRYRNSQRDFKKIARDLGATLLVDGGIQRANGQWVVPVNLVQASSNRVVWGTSYNISAEEILEVNRKLAEGLIGALRVSPTPAERTRVLSLPTSSRDAFADYSQARTFLERLDVPGNIDRAVRLFQSAIAKDSKFALAYAGLGDSYLAKYDRTHDPSLATLARESTNEALRLDPDRAETRCSLGRILQATGHPEEATDELNKAIALQPNSDEAHSLLGSIFLSEGRSDDAIAQYRLALEIRPQSWTNHSHLGRAYFQLGRLPEAILSFQRVTELQPDSAWGFQMLGTAYHVLGDTDKALKNYLQAISISPSGAAYANIGFIYYGKQNYPEAARYYEKAVQITPASPITRRNLADVYQKMGEREKAREAYAKSIALAEGMLKINPKDGRTLALMALCQAKLGLRDEAARHADEALALNPKDSEVIYKKAIVHALAGQQDEALAALKQALESGYSPGLAQADDDLAGLKKSPRFLQLFATKR